MPPLSVLIKPVSSKCNLRCRYCFYHSIAKNRMTTDYGVMSLELLEEVVRKALSHADKVCTFAFQGGEPTLAGLDFYKKLVELERKYSTGNVKISNAIQTNGVIIDSHWADFFAKNRFLVGISLDGPKEIHDLNRTDISEKGSFSKVMNAIRLFNDYKVEYNVLTVVNNHTARHIHKIYDFFKGQGFAYLQFIPCLDPLDEAPGLNDYSLKPERFTYFLKTLFDLWYRDITSGKTISIRYFDNLAGIFLGYPPEECGMLGHCQCQFVIEADGGVYPCDFYVTDKWLLGNIKDNKLDIFEGTDTCKSFTEPSKKISDECGACKWFSLCRGGCRRYREPFADRMPVLNQYCSSYREFFEYAYERLLRVKNIFGAR